jgi:hypothetical protein
MKKLPLQKLFLCELKRIGFKSLESDSTTVQDWGCPKPSVEYPFACPTAITFGGRDTQASLLLERSARKNASRVGSFTVIWA